MLNRSTPLKIGLLIAVFSFGHCKKLEIDSNCLNLLASCYKPDKTPPTVASSQPLPNAGSTSVSLLSAIQVTFSEELKDMTNIDHYDLSGPGSVALTKASVDKIGPRTVQLNLTGTVNNGAITLTFPGLTDYGNNTLVAGSSVNLTGNVNIGVVFEDVSTTYYVSNISATGQPTRVTSVAVHWHHTYDKNANNTYTIKLGGSNCDDPAGVPVAGISSPGGAISAGQTVTTTIAATNSVFSNTDGNYVFLVCVKNAEMNKASDNDFFTVIRDSTAPQITYDVGGGSYGAAQTVNFTCTDHCDRIAYKAESGVSPAIPLDPSQFGAGGTTTESLITGPWPVPHDNDPWTTNIKLIAYDKAGNQSAVTNPMLVYTINTNIPVITFGNPASTHNYISPTGYTSTILNWSSNKTGSYLICRGGTGCGTAPTPTCAGGGSTVGSPTATNYNTIGQPVSSTVNAAAPLAAGANTIHICFATAAQMGDVTRTVTIDNSAPTLVSATPGNGATGLFPNAKLQLSFADNTGIDSATVQASNGSCTHGTVQLSTSASFSPGTCVALGSVVENPPKTFTIQPASQLIPGVYWLRITNGVKDLAGNSYAGMTQTNGFVVGGLLRQFTFNDDASDLVNQAGSYPLTAFGSPQKMTGVNGDTNGAYKFSGNSSQYLRGLDTGLPAGSAPRTFCAWLQVNRCSDSSALCMAAMYGSTTEGPYLGAYKGHYGLGVFGNGDFETTIANSLMTWAHFCSVYDGTSFTAYVNGIASGVFEPVSSPAPINTVLGDGLTIGQQSGLGSGYVFDGGVDDVRVYVGALSPAQIREIAIQVPNGLLAYYPFSDAGSGTALDQTGNGHTGLRQGSPLPVATTDRFQQTGAYTFGSPSQYITAKDTGLPSGNAPRTMCAWMRPTALPATGQYRIAARYGQPLTGAANYIGLYHDGAQQTVIFSGWSDHVTSPFTAIVNNWLHLCGSYDGTTAKLYANGQLVSTATKTWNTVLIGNDGIIIGQGDTTGTFPFAGAVDDVRFYNRVLADAEIRVLSTQLGTGLMRQYSLDGIGTGSLRDDAGSGQTLAINGGPGRTVGYDGRANGAYVFNGGTNFLTTSVAGLPSGAAPQTMCVWLNTSSSCGAGICMAAMYGDTESGGPYIGIWNGNVRYGSYGILDASSVAAIPNGTWHHVCSIFDGTTASVYVNGIFDNSQIPGTLWNTGTTGDLTIGRQADGSGFGFTGAVDTVRIYNRVLLPAEIMALQNY